MGQYYKPVLEDVNKNLTVFYSHDYGNGLKLMEHSYFDNNFVEAIVFQLWKRPQRVAWIGDYSDGIFSDAYEKKTSRTQLMRFYNAAWGKREKRPLFRPVKDGDLPACGLLLMNHTACAYIDLDEHFSANKDKIHWCVHPLPLLTACGNGRGGGDYRMDIPDIRFIGSWAFDLLEVTDGVPPVGYEKKEFRFPMDF